MNKVAGFFKDVVDELKKVSWTTKQELVDSTIIVMVSLLVMAVYVGLVDWMLAAVVKKIMQL